MRRAGLEMTEPTKLTIKDYVLPIIAAVAWVALVRAGPLDLPYFWDEADVYAPGAKWVAEHALDVRPGVFPDEWGRGHPPLFYWLSAIPFALFGPSPAVAHLFVLPFTVLALAGTYWLGATLFGRGAGAAAAALLAVTPLFMSTGNMLLPEPLLVAGTVLALLALARGRLGVAVIISIALVLLKETGIFTGAAVGLAVLYDAWRRGELGTVPTARRAALATAPLLALLAFFAWQKARTGYYIFPVHEELLFSRRFGLDTVATVLPSLFAWHERWLLGNWRRARARDWGPRHAPRARCASPRATPRWASGHARHGHRRRARARRVQRDLLLEDVLARAVRAARRTRGPRGPHGDALRRARALESRPAWLRAALPVAVVALAFGAGAHALHSATEPDAEEHTFAYADVIRTHRAAFAHIDRDTTASCHDVAHDRRARRSRISATSSTRCARRTRDASGASLRSRSPRSTVAPHLRTLRRSASKRGIRGLVHRFVAQIGVAPALEVWTRGGPT